MIKKLSLNLQKKWFDMHLQDKNEEYRDIKPSFCNALLLYMGEVKPRKFWKAFLMLESIENLERKLSIGVIAIIGYTYIEFSNGMKPIDILPRFTKSFEGLRIGYGKPEWGAPTDRKVFIIECDGAINKRNCNIKPKP